MLGYVSRNVSDVHTRLRHYRPGVIFDRSEDGSVGTTLAVKKTCRRNHKQAQRENACRRGHDVFSSRRLQPRGMGIIPRLTKPDDGTFPSPKPHVAVYWGRMLPLTAEHR